MFIASVHPEANISRVFAALGEGERSARDAARKQADIAPDGKARRFLLAQARQEAFHAWVCDGAVHWLAPDSAGASALPAAVKRALRRYAERIGTDLAEREFTRSLVGMQVVFEGLGAVVLGKLDIGLSKHGKRFAPLRRILLRQEDAHHEFGVRCLQRLIASDAERAGLGAACAGYCELSDADLRACSELFGDFDAEIAEYIEQARTGLPAFLAPPRVILT
ncbi:MAG: hypothetical protein H0V78_14110 [Burkholderiales bacterium]|nr:hypothetical protein [Burkholderiales bacterium]